MKSINQLATEISNNLIYVTNYEKTKLNSDIEKLSEQIHNDVDTVFLIKTDE